MKSAASPANAAISHAKVSGVPLLDIQRQHAPLRAEIDAALARVCDSGRFILGPDCEELESEAGRLLPDALTPWLAPREAMPCCWR